MELPECLADRISRLRHPEDVIVKIMSALEEAERRDQMHGRFDASRVAWASLDPDLRQRYLEAMGQKNIYRLLQPHERSPEQRSVADQLLERAQATADETYSRWEEFKCEQEAAVLRSRKQAHEAMLTRLAEAGLPYRTELVYPGMGPEDD